MASATTDIETGVPSRVVGLESDPLDELMNTLKEEYDDWMADDYKHDVLEIEYLERQLSPAVRHTNHQQRVVVCCGTCCTEKPEERSQKFRRNVRRVVNLLNLSPRQKSLILDRYVFLMEQYGDTKRRFTRAYNATRFFTTLCGIITPALISIQPFFGSDLQNPIYWSTWGTSLTAALLNGYIALYKVDRKYISSTRAYLQLESEGWQFFGLVGKYGPSEDDLRPTHNSRFSLFIQNVEDIRKGEARVNYMTGTSDVRSASVRTRSTSVRGGGKPSRTPSSPSSPSPEK